MWNYQGRTWYHKDKPLVYKKPKARGKSVTIYGCLSSYHQFMLFEFGISTNTEEFQDFLVQIDQKYSFKDKIVVMDNHSSHTNNDTVESIRELGGEVCFLPTRASELNPIERAWSILKQKWRQYLLSRRECDEFGEEDMRPAIKKILKEAYGRKIVQGL